MIRSFLKKFKPEQVQNIVFTALVVIAAFAIYLLAHSQTEQKLESAPSPLPSSVKTESETRSFQGVPEEVLFAALEKESLLSVTREDGRALLGYRSETGVLRLTKENGFVCAFELTLPIPTPFEATNPESEIECALERRYRDALAAQDEAIRQMLASVLAANDLNETLRAATVERWSANAIRVRNEDTTFTDHEAGCTFQACLSGEKGAQTLVITFFDES